MPSQPSPLSRAPTPRAVQPDTGALNPQGSFGGGAVGGLDFLAGGRAATADHSKGTFGWRQLCSPMRLVMSEEAYRARQQRTAFLKEARSVCLTLPTAQQQRSACARRSPALAFEILPASRRRC